MPAIYTQSGRDVGTVEPLRSWRILPNSLPMTNIADTDSNPDTTSDWLLSRNIVLIYLID